MLVVEHEPQVIAIADRVVDMGPGAGVHGGTVVYQGDVPGLRASETITGRHFSTVRTLKENVRDPAGALRIEHATLHNLRDVTVDVPLGVAVRPMLAALGDVGLGYVRLGQPLTTLSGGERQHIKLAIEVDRASEVLVLDEPTTGLHMHDVDNLDLLNGLVERGRTLIVIEHDLDVVAGADWVIDIGPGPGHDGGTIVFEGPPHRLVEAEGSLTGRHLADRLAAA